MTLIGITIGVASLVAFTSFGVGLQQISLREYRAFEADNALHVTSHPRPVNPFDVFTFKDLETDTIVTSVVPITDELLQQIRAIPGVSLAFPDDFFLVKVRTSKREVLTNVQPIPMEFVDIPRYRPIAGSFFSTSTDSSLLITEELTRLFGYRNPRDAVGDTLEVGINVLRLSGFRFGFFSQQGSLRNLPFVERKYRVKVAGILADEAQSITSIFRIAIPIDLFKDLPKLTEDAISGIVLQQSPTGGYDKIQVHVPDQEDVPSVRAAIEQYGLYVNRYRGQYEKQEQTLAVLDVSLFILGTIALIVATIGMSNTMITNVVERTREIGIIKAIGGEDRDVLRMFLIESGMMGFFGSLAGLLFGWVVTGLLDRFVNFYFHQVGRPGVILFFFSWPILLGIFILTIIVSVIAGSVPARRAASIEPILALRY